MQRTIQVFSLAESESFAVTRWQQYYFAVEGVGQILGERGRRPLIIVGVRKPECFCYLTVKTASKIA